MNLAHQICQSIDFKSISKVAKSIESLKIDEHNLESVIAATYQRSPAYALKLSKAIIRRNTTDADSSNLNEIKSLVKCGCSEDESNAGYTDMVCTAFRQTKMNFVLIHLISSLNENDTNAYMMSYFQSNGDMRTVVEWMEFVGKVLSLHRQAPSTMQPLSTMQHLSTMQPKPMSWLGDRFKEGANFITDFVGDIYENGRDRLKNLYNALKNTGKGLADILTTAVELPLKDVVNLVGSLVDEIGKSVTVILEEAKKLGKKALGKLVEALITLKQSVTAVVNWVYKKSYKTIASIIKNIQESFRKGFFEGLIALGKSPLKLLQASFELAMEVGVITFTALLEIFGEYRKLSNKELAQARKIFGWSIELHQVKICVGSLPVEIINWFNKDRPFTTMNLINFAPGTVVDLGTLIHELTHVWQSENDGPIYAVEAIREQISGGAYKVTKDDIKYANGNLTNLGREQQAVVVELYWRGKHGKDSSIDFSLYEQLARQVYKKQPQRYRLPRDVDFRSLPDKPLLGGQIP